MTQPRNLESYPSYVIELMEKAAANNGAVTVDFSQTYNNLLQKYTAEGLINSPEAQKHLQSERKKAHVAANKLRNIFYGYRAAVLRSTNKNLTTSDFNPQKAFTFSFRVCKTDRLDATGLVCFCRIESVNVESNETLATALQNALTEN